MKCWWFKTVVGIGDEPRDTKAHWVNPWQFSSNTPEQKRKHFCKRIFGSESSVVQYSCCNKRRHKGNSGPLG